MAGLMMKYFVLKPAGDDIYSIASRHAMREYAKVIKEANPEFAKDILFWVDSETKQSDQNTESG